jgi:phage gp36-like protein
MAYSSEDDVIAVLIGRRSENRNETPADLDIDQIRFAIADADAQINLALKRRYVVPFDVGSVPDLVKSLSVSIASYLALLVFRGAVPIVDGDPLALRYDRARRMLDAIQSGKVDIDGAIENTEVSDATPAVYNEFQEPIFPLYPIFEEGYIPPDKLYK